MENVIQLQMLELVLQQHDPTGFGNHHSSTDFIFMDVNLPSGTASSFKPARLHGKNTTSARVYVDAEI